jgi:hypothetical protein
MMFLKKASGQRAVTLADGSVLSLADLPAKGTRWVASRKEVVVLAVRHGLVDRTEILARYDLTDEEFCAWQSAFTRHGREALKITALQKFR